MNEAHTLIDYLTQTAWAMEPQTLGRLAEVIFARDAGLERTAAEVAAAARYPASAAARGTKTAADERIYEVRKGAAILPVGGIIAKYARMVNGPSQPRGTSVELLGQQLASALADEEVTSIFLHIESPGGAVDGLADLADEVFRANEQKPVTAYADGIAASAAYWIGSQAGRFYASQSATVGSIGVRVVMVDSSEAAGKRGFRIVPITTGSGKAIGVPGKPITEADEAMVQDLVNAHFQMFLAAVRRGRSELTAEQVETLADGRVFIGRQAVKVGLIDGIKTFAQALTSAKPRPGRVSPAQSSSNLERGDDMDLKHEEHAQVVVGSALEITSGPEAPRVPEADTESVATEIARAERERIAAIDAALPGEAYAELRARARDESWSVMKARAEAFAMATAQVAAVQGQLDALTAALNRAGIDPIALGSSDEEADPEADGSAIVDDGQPKTFDRAVAARVEAGEKRSAAYSHAARDLPKSFAAWTAAGQAYASGARA